MARSFYRRNRPIKEEHYDTQTFGMKDLGTIYQEKQQRESMEQFLLEMLTINAKAQMATIREYIISLRDSEPTYTTQGLAKTFELCKKEYYDYAEHLSEIHSPISQWQIDNIWNTQIEQLRTILRIRQ